MQVNDKINWDNYSIRLLRFANSMLLVSSHCFKYFRLSFAFGEDDQKELDFSNGRQRTVKLRKKFCSFNFLH